jgi:multidrug efflux system membrane fusion protein
MDPTPLMPPPPIASPEARRLRLFRFWQRLPAAWRPVALLAPLAALVMVRALLNASPAPLRKPIPLVETAPVVKGNMDVRYPITAEVRPLVSAEVRPEVSGVIRRVFFREGTVVGKGDPLFQISPSTYLVALDQAHAATVRSQARRQEAQAQVQLAAVQLRLAKDRAQRYTGLLGQGALSVDDAENYRTQADVARANLAAAHSSASSAEADVQAARAAEALARLNLDRTLIRSPIRGRIGQQRITVGNLVRDQEDKPLVVVNQESPLDVIFGIPQQWQGRVSVGQTVTIDRVPPLTGRIVSLDNTTNAGTGTITAKARLETGAKGLTPGDNVNGSVLIRRLTDALLIPSVALQAGQRGPFVYVVRNSHAAMVPLVVLAKDARRTAVSGSLVPGENVVVAGQFALAPGAAVRAVPRHLAAQKTSEAPAGAAQGQ